MADGPGRSCPLAYRYGAKALAGPAALQVDTLWIAGGLYGNREALETLLDLYEGEQGSKALAFNGDFHWFDVAHEDFMHVNGAVLRHHATRGNVETELAFPSPGTGCGCGYPDWVGDAEVGRSNRIIERLRAAAASSTEALRALAALPMHLVAEVGGERVGIVHGDADSLAGWGFSQETLGTKAGIDAARAAFAAAQARIFASSHTCLPVLQSVGDACVVVNNGAAGMPNFSGTRFGLATRISVRPSAGALYGAHAGALEVEARPIRYDHDAWRKRFLASWPQGTDAHASYFPRIENGPGYELTSAVRAGSSATRRAA
jgi:hypothetical protein